jgi:hypothetical protein
MRACDKKAVGCSKIGNVKQGFIRFFSEQLVLHLVGGES